MTKSFFPSGQVEVLAARYDQDRYFKVRGNACEGWVRDSFVNPRYQVPIEERVEP